jgi:beta-N-acetylglucosaminidase
VGIFAISGVLEGFYGTPWTWTQRRAVMERCVGAGLPWYAWAPKSDPLHREEWRTPFTNEHLDGFADLLSIESLKLCVAIAPGLEATDFGDNFDFDVATLVNKLKPVIALAEARGTHTPMVMIAFDDLGPDVTDPDRHARVVCALSESFGDRAQLCVVPVHYAGIAQTQYLAMLDDHLPPDVLIAWTGPLVVNEAITANEARLFSKAVSGRPLLLWDNYPVNDAFLRDQLFLQPLSGRDPGLSETCVAYFANAAIQPMLSLPPLLSVGAWCEGNDPSTSWHAFEEPDQLAMLADACDGTELFQLAEAAIHDSESPAFGELRTRLQALAVLRLSGSMGEEATPWIKQANAEASLSLIAVELLATDVGNSKVPEFIIGLLLKWPNVSRAKVCVFGPRLGVRPAMGISANGVWTATAPLIIEDRNATDLLCRAALQRHTVPPDDLFVRSSVGPFTLLP